MEETWVLDRYHGTELVVPTRAIQIAVCFPLSL